MFQILIPGIEILIIWVMIYYLLSFFWNTRAMDLLFGFLAFLGLYTFATWFHLPVLQRLMLYFVNVAVIVSPASASLTAMSVMATLAAPSVYTELLVRLVAVGATFSDAIVMVLVTSAELSLPSLTTQVTVRSPVSGLTTLVLV